MEERIERALLEATGKLYEMTEALERDGLALSDLSRVLIDATETKDITIEKYTALARVTAGILSMAAAHLEKIVMGIDGQTEKLDKLSTEINK